MGAVAYEELKNLVFLNRFGCARHLTVALRELGSASEVLRKIQEENFLGKAEAFEKLSAKFDPDREIESCLQRGIRLLSIFDGDYPALLREISDPPVLLYVKGSLVPSDSAAVAVVGSRHPSFYGTTQARRFARELSEQGVTIVSGFAQGIDRAAHEACLGVRHGRTLAVLGSGIDVIYPRDHGDLYERIAGQGAVITEYALGAQPLAENFPKRNRIIAGLATGVLVVEAHERSGSLITAHEALDQGREVFAIPGPVDQLTSRGTHRLIKEGAVLVETPADVFDVLAPFFSGYRYASPDTKKSSQPETLAPETKKAKEIFDGTKSSWAEDEQRVLTFLREGAFAFDEISEKCSLLSGKAVSLVTKLELKRKIRKNPDGRFALASVRQNEADLLFSYKGLAD